MNEDDVKVVEDYGAMTTSSAGLQNASDVRSGSSSSCDDDRLEEERGSRIDDKHHWHIGLTGEIRVLDEFEIGSDG